MSKISKELDAKIREQAKYRCGYCLASQKLVSYRLEIEHIFPRAKGGSNKEENLWLACRQCNLTKSSKTHGLDLVTFAFVKLFNPRNQVWSEHFDWSEDKTIITGKTSCGRATVLALQLNSDSHKTVREFWRLTGIFPPED